MFLTFQETRANGLGGGEPEDAPEEAVPDPSDAFKEVQLRLLLREREQVASRLIRLDFAIWAIEEFFRSGNP